MKPMLACFTVFGALCLSVSQANADPIDNLQPGHWLRVPNSQAMQVTPNPLAPGSTAPRAVMDSWGGGAFDTYHNRLLVWGGGHANYAGNEVYAFNVDAAFDDTKQNWTLPFPGTPVSDIPTANEAYEVYPDNNPSSRHTYHGLAYIPPPIDALWAQGGSRWYKGFGTGALWLFNDTKGWVQKNNAPDSRLGLESVYDPVSGKVIQRGNTSINEYDPVTEQWRTLYNSKDSWWSDSMSAAIAPGRRLIVYMGLYEGSTEFGVFNLETHEFTIPSRSGDTGIESAHAPGLAYDPVMDKVVAWNGGGDVYTLDLDSWRWTRHAPAAGSEVPGTPAKHGTFGRFRYVPSKKAFILVNGMDRDVFFYRLSDDITTISLENLTTDDMQNVPVSFGHVFASGDVQSGTTVGARLSDGTEVALQVDKKAFHGDGSLRHAVLTAVLPALAPLQQKSVTLYRKPESAAAAPLSPNATIRDGLVSVDLDIGGTKYIATSHIVPESALWLSGDLVTEWVVKAPFINSSDSSQHPHLAARINIRAYSGFKHVRTSVVVENNWAYVPDPNYFKYNVTIRVNGGNGAGDYVKTNLTHFNHARWRKVLWREDNNGSVSVSERYSKVHVKFDPAYLLSTGAIPNYDLSITVPESKLVDLEAKWNGAKTEPMGIGEIRATEMASTGGRPELGPLPRWAAIHLLSQDRRAEKVDIGTSESGGSWPIHYRHKATDLPVSLEQFPYATITGSYSGTLNPNTGQHEAFSTALCKSSGCPSPYKPDSAHQPSFAYYPYLVTGDQFHLEEMMFWVNWTMMRPGAQYRGYEQGLVVGTQAHEVRGQAWAMRKLGQTAYITPDAHPMKSYFVDRVHYNLKWFNDNYTNLNPNALGYIYPSASKALEDARPWMDDFFTWSIGYLVALGFDEAKPLLAWKSKFPLGRMTDPGYCWIYASNYGLKLGVNPNSYYASFKEVYDQTIGDTRQCGSADMASALGLDVGEMVGNSQDPDGYPSVLQIALAAATETGDPLAWQAWNLFESRSVKPDYSSAPQYAIVPRGSGRAGGGMPTSGGSPSNVTVQLSPSLIQVNTQASLSWFTSVNSGACTASGAWSGSQATSGNMDVGPYTEAGTYDFTLTCGDFSSTARLTVSDGLPVGGGLVSLPASDLVADLVVVDTTNGDSWSLQDNAQSGDTMYGDRDYRLGTMPGEVDGLAWIQTANDSKSFTGGTLVSFKVLTDVAVYVAYRDDAPVPAWLAAWTDTGTDFSNSEPKVFSLYKREFNAGDTVNLGANGDNQVGMYTVFIAGKVTPREPANEGGAGNPATGGTVAQNSGGGGGGALNVFWGIAVLLLAGMKRYRSFRHS